MAAGGLQPVDDTPRLVRPGRIGRHQLAPAPGRSRRCAQVVGERHDPVVPHVAGPLHQLLLAARVVQPDVGDGATLLVVGLRGDPGAGVVLGHAALLDQPSHPHLDVGVHHHDQREHRRHSGFHQQRNVFDDNRILGHRRDDLRAALAHQRVHDPVQLLARLVVAKSLGRQRRPIQRSVRQQDVVAERLDERRQALRCRAGPPRGR